MKYKTKMCDNFNKKGSCLYGVRCNFIHRERSKVKDNRKKEVSIELGMVRLSARGRSRLLLLLEGGLV
jgi:hypothetical protein